MKLIDGKEFECKKCGECCKWEGVVVLTPGDIKRIADHFSLDDTEFLNRYAKRSGSKNILKNKPGSSSCIFLENNRCSIWNIQPEQCSEYPKHYEKRCPGFQIDNRSASMSDKYEKAIKAVREKLSNDGEFEKNIINGVFGNLQGTIKSASIISVASENGIDPFLDDKRVKVASLDDLFSFDRIGSNQLIHKCTKELWAIDSDKDGTVQITRLFDNSGEPIKG